MALTSPIAPTSVAARVAGASRGQETAKLLNRIRKITWWMDRSIQVPGTSWRIGLDGLLGLVPGVGDFSTALVSAYLIHLARKNGISNRDLLRMIGNLAVDLGVGAIPVVGDLIDFMWKSNTKNLRILEDHLLEKQRQAHQLSPRSH